MIDYILKIFGKDPNNPVFHIRRIRRDDLGFSLNHILVKENDGSVKKYNITSCTRNGNVLIRELYCVHDKTYATLHRITEFASDKFTVENYIENKKIILL